MVLDKGFVRVVNSMGSDLAVIASARVSNGVTWEEASKGEEADQKLINYLMRNRHGSPFEHAVFTFHVKCPIFVAREWQRHRIGSYNEVSGRYTEFKPEFYIPAAFRQPSASNKQGSEFLEDPNADAWLERNMEKISLTSYDNYKFLLNQGLAKEMARMVLPLNSYTEFYWTVNARSLMNFLSLRQNEDAQWEIRQYALAIKEMFKEAMPQTYGAWERSGYLAP
jgi:thymidylate synthase (FAD)